MFRASLLRSGNSRTREVGGDQNAAGLHFGPSMIRRSRMRRDRADLSANGPSGGVNVAIRSDCRKAKRTAAVKLGDGTKRRAFAREIATVLALLAGLGTAAAPSSAADVERGMQLAQQWCANCHVLPDNPRQTAQQGPPSFRDIARGDKTADQLRVVLISPHSPMPQMTLSRAEIDDLIGYIESLR
jgi:mono/diheme cytochrome c family protein